MRTSHRAALMGAAMGLAAWNAHAEEPAAATQSDQSLAEVVVTGTRSAGRSTLRSPAPIDAFGAPALRATGNVDLARAIEFLEPSVNFARAATTATAANTRPITLRGLAPDQVLVLVNGKRRQATSILNTNNAVGRGSAGVDLDTIPVAAIERVEILRDGAAAQYGSDAIAGVVNVILRSDRSGGYAALQGGVTGEGDGAYGDASGWVGLPLGREGRLTVSAEARSQDATNRALVDQRFGRVTYRIGDPRIALGSLALNGQSPVGVGEAYGFLTYTHKDSDNAAGFRVPGFSPVWPNGFLPIINPKIDDLGASLGWRATLPGGWKLDLSNTYGFDQAHIDVHDTANASLGVASPTRFYAGSTRYTQDVTDLTLSRPLSVLAGANVAAGLQHRYEAYTITRGERAAVFGLGADGFAGFDPPVDRSRTAYAGFVDVELSPTSAWLLGAAGRYDHYGDFGGAATWKASARWQVVPVLALRATAGDGFRAPSLQQQYFSAIAGALSAGQLVTVGTLPVDSPVARALGAGKLKPERSTNLTAGFVLDPGHGFTLTADWFHIAIRDRIALSEQLAGAPVLAALKAAGVTTFQQVRFFTNAVDTTTDGFEVTARYRRDLGTAGMLSVQAGYGRFPTNLDKLRPNPVLPSLPLLAPKSILYITAAQPKDKTTAAAQWAVGRWTVNGQVAAFGPYTSLPLLTPQTFNGGTVVDLGLSYRVTGGLTLAAGVQNLGDVRPDKLRENSLAAAISSTGGSFPTGEESPIGMNGRSFFARVEARF